MNIYASNSPYSAYFIFVEGLLPSYHVGLRLQSSLASINLNTIDYETVTAYINTLDIQLRVYPGTDKNWSLYGAIRFLTFFSILANRVRCSLLIWPVGMRR